MILERLNSFFLYLTRVYTTPIKQLNSSELSHALVLFWCFDLKTIALIILIIFLWFN